jgi:hypothetical protein
MRILPCLIGGKPLRLSGAFWAAAGGLSQPPNNDKKIAYDSGYGELVYFCRFWNIYYFTFQGRIRRMLAVMETPRSVQ